MKKTFKEVAHLYYGCQMVLIHNDGSSQQCELDPIIFSWIVQENGIEMPFELKPILHRLEDMTDEHCLEAATILRAECYTENHVRIAGVKEIIKRAHNMQTNILMGEWIQLFTWMLSKGYDLFQLIDNGQAIDAKTIVDE